MNPTSGDTVPPTETAGLCPVHLIPDCSPMLNGCTRLTAPPSTPGEDARPWCTNCRGPFPEYGPTACTPGCPCQGIGRHLCGGLGGWRDVAEMARAGLHLDRPVWTCPKCAVKGWRPAHTCPPPSPAAADGPTRAYPLTEAQRRATRLALLESGSRTRMELASARGAVSSHDPCCPSEVHRQEVMVEHVKVLADRMAAIEQAVDILDPA